MPSSVKLITSNPSDRSLVVNALRLAAEQYTKDSVESAGIPRLQEGFTLQAKRANELAEEFEVGTTD